MDEDQDLRRLRRLCTQLFHSARGEVRRRLGELAQGLHGTAERAGARDFLAWLRRRLKFDADRPCTSRTMRSKMMFQRRRAIAGLRRATSSEF